MPGRLAPPTPRQALLLGLALAVLALLPAPVRAEEDPAARAARAARLAALREQYGEQATPSWWLRKAERLAAGIQVPDGKAALLISIGTGWVDAGEREGGRALLAQAALFARQCQACPTKAERLADVAVLQHRAGDDLGAAGTFDLAREACEEVKGAARVRALAYLAVREAEAGEDSLSRISFGAAAGGVAGLEGTEQAEALGAIVAAHADRGDLEGARAPLERLALLVARGDGTAAAAASEAHLAVAQAWVLRREYEAAGKAVQQIPDPAVRVAGHTILARALWDAGHRDRAGTALAAGAALARTLPDPQARAAALLDVAGTAERISYANLAQPLRREAEAVALAVEGPAARVGLLAAVAARDDEAGDAPAARRALAAAEAAVAALAPPPVDLLRPVVAAHANAGRLEDAFRVAATVSAPVIRAEAFVDVAEGAARKGPAATAVDLCTRLEAGLLSWPAELAADRDRVLRRIVVVQSLAGRPDLAAATVEKIAAPFHAATACTYVARDLVP